VQVLSISSAVSYGHVGNSAAVFPLQRLGHEVMPVSTVLFSNHTGYGAWRGAVVPADQVREVIAGIEERGALAGTDLVLSGYLGSPELAEVVLEAVEKVKLANPDAVYACDPVMGNAHSGSYVDPAIPPLMRTAVLPRADLITPNQFELGLLSGAFTAEADPSLVELVEAAQALRAAGPATVLVSSVEHAGCEPDTTGLLAVTGSGAWSVRTPRLPLRSNGAGDVTAALFAAHLATTGDVRTALARTASSVFDLLEATLEAKSRELRLVQSQDVFVRPRLQFEVVPVSD